MKKTLIAIAILILLLYLVFKSDRVQDHIDRFCESHKVNLIQPVR